MTPRILAREFEAARLRAVDRFRQSVTDGWNVARMYAAVRSKKGLSALSKYLDEVKAEQGDSPQGASDMKLTVEMLSQMSGIPMRRAKARG